MKTGGDRGNQKSKHITCKLCFVCSGITFKDQRPIKTASLMSLQLEAAVLYTSLTIEGV